MAAKKKPAKKPAARPAKAAKPAAKKAAPAKKAKAAAKKPSSSSKAPAKKAKAAPAKKAKAAAPKKAAPAKAAPKAAAPKAAKAAAPAPKKAESLPTKAAAVTAAVAKAAATVAKAAVSAVTHAPPSAKAAVTSTPSPAKTSAPKKAAGPAGKVIWHDLMTVDVDKARSFYTSLLAWKTYPKDLAPLGTTQRIEVAGQEIGGVVSLPTSEGIASHWMPYVEVKDLDAVVRKAKELGGFVPVPPTSLDGLGRFAVIADPRGAHISPIEPAEGAELATDQPQLGQVSWNEVLSDDPEGTARFFAEVFGWGTESKAMGDMGNYTIFTSGKEQLAGCMKAPEGMPPMWLSYWTVNNVDSSVNRAKQLGAQLTAPAMDIPFGRCAWLADPTGAPFALFQPSSP